MKTSAGWQYGEEEQEQEQRGEQASHIVYILSTYCTVTAEEQRAHEDERTRSRPRSGSGSFGLGTPSCKLRYEWMEVEDASLEQLPQRRYFSLQWRAGVEKSTERKEVVLDQPMRWLRQQGHRHKSL